MRNILSITVVATSIMLTVSVLLQNQASGLGTAFGGDSGFYRTKRGAEKALFYITIILAIIFVGALLGLLFVA